MATDERFNAFEEWLAKHNKNGQTQNYVVQVIFMPGQLPGRPSYDYDVISYDASGVVLKYIAQQGATPEYYPWSSILRMV